MDMLNTKSNKITKGFTLIEILIASSIFAIALVFTTATISQGGSFYSKLKAQKSTSEDTRKIADMLSRDIRAANTGFSYTFNPANPSDVTEYSYGLALLSCRPLCTSTYNPSAPSVMITNDFNINSNALVVGVKSDNIISYNVYYSKYSQYTPVFTGPTGIYFKSFSSLPTLDQIANITTSSNLLSDAKNDAAVSFAGFTPGWSVKAQPFVKFRIESKTKNFDNLPVPQRSYNIIESMVVTRNYEK